MKDDTPIELGADILLYEGDNVDVITTLSVERFRFLDVLWLPVRLGKLSREQIEITNRFREERIEEAQFRRSSRSRECVQELIRQFGFRNVLEIGCGKFPLSRELEIERYVGIDIDASAVEFCTSLGIEAYTDISEVPDQPIELLVAIFVFHFPVSREDFYKLSAMMAEDGVLVSNIIVDDSLDIFWKLSYISENYPAVAIVKADAMAAREIFVVAGQSEGATLVTAVRAFLADYWTPTIL
jgi:hypothetical protein